MSFVDMIVKLNEEGRRRLMAFLVDLVKDPECVNREEDTEE